MYQQTEVFTAAAHPDGTSFAGSKESDGIRALLGPGMIRTGEADDRAPRELSARGLAVDWIRDVSGAAALGGWRTQSCLFRT